MNNVINIDANKNLAIENLQELILRIQKDEIECFVLVAKDIDNETLTMNGNIDYDQLCQVIGHLQCQCTLMAIYGDE